MGWEPRLNDPEGNFGRVLYLHSRCDPEAPLLCDYLKSKDYRYARRLFILGLLFTLVPILLSRWKVNLE